MRVLIQRVRKARVTTPQGYDRTIGPGLLIFVGIEHADTTEDAIWLAAKIVNLRIFNDQQGVMNRSVLDVAGSILVVSQFTLHARTKKGNRPSYVDAASPEMAIPLYEFFVSKLEELLQQPVATGVFGAHMDVDLVNDGPVTIWIDTKQKQ